MVNFATFPNVDSMLFWLSNTYKVFEVIDLYESIENLAGFKAKVYTVKFDRFI